MLRIVPSFLNKIDVADQEGRVEEVMISRTRG
jgi:hypothetical protein